MPSHEVLVTFKVKQYYIIWISGCVVISGAFDTSSYMYPCILYISNVHISYLIIPYAIIISLITLNIWSPMNTFFKNVFIGDQMLRVGVFWKIYGMRFTNEPLSHSIIFINADEYVCKYNAIFFHNILEIYTNSYSWERANIFHWIASSIVWS